MDKDKVGEGETPEEMAGETPEGEKPEGEKPEGAGAGAEGAQKPAATVEGLAAELEATRRALRKANAEAADRRKRLDALEAEEQKRKDASLSELEKAQKAAEDLKAQLDQVTADLDGLRMRQAFYEAAAGVVWANDQARRDAFDLSDLSAVEVDDDGKVSGMDKVVKGLQKERPHLFGAEKPPDINAGAQGKGRGEGDVEGIKRRFGL